MKAMFDVTLEPGSRAILYVPAEWCERIVDHSKNYGAYTVVISPDGIMYRIPSTRYAGYSSIFNIKGENVSTKYQLTTKSEPYYEVVGRSSPDLEDHPKGVGKEYTEVVNDIETTVQNLREDGLNTGVISDGYHTFNELYKHRAILFNIILQNYPQRAWKSWKHSDGTMYDQMFIAGIETPEGQYTYHIEDVLWNTFNVRELSFAPPFDGHKPDDIGRLNSLIDDNYTHPAIKKVAREVIDGIWGTGRTRYMRLREAGFDYKAVQREVNRILDYNWRGNR